MQELTGQSALRVGVDLAKNVIQVHAENERGKVLWAKALSRQKFLDWCASNLPAGTVVALANKHARIVWAMLAKGLSFDARHVSQWAHPKAEPENTAAALNAA